MLTDTEGVVLRQIKAAYGRRMVPAVFEKIREDQRGKQYSVRKEEAGRRLAHASLLPTADTSFLRIGTAIMSIQCGCDQKLLRDRGRRGQVHERGLRAGIYARRVLSGRG